MVWHIVPPVRCNPQQHELKIVRATSAYFLPRSSRNSTGNLFGLLVILIVCAANSRAFMAASSLLLDLIPFGTDIAHLILVLTLIFIIPQFSPFGFSRKRDHKESSGAGVRRRLKLRLADEITSRNSTNSAVVNVAAGRA